MEQNLNNVKIEVSGISKYFGSKCALNKVDFQVFNGEFLSILGPSGCGKTTLLRILIGLLKPTEGKIIKDGKDITSYTACQRNMGIVFQNYALFENMTVLQNVEYALKKNKKLKANSRQIALYMLEDMGLSDYLNRKPSNLSGGQQQRVAIARTLVLNPDVILFDEPMSALDIDTRLSLRKVIKDIQSKYKTTMIYITHDQEEAFALSDRVLIMKEANLVQIDTPANIISAPANEFIEAFVIKNLQTKVDSLIRFVR